MILQYVLKQSLYIDTADSFKELKPATADY